MVWQRARSDEQKAQRRQMLLEAAARLHKDRPIEEVSLNAIAREANISKANVYRYFESREELFLELTLDAAEQWRDALARRLQPLQKTEDAEALAGAFTAAALENPRFARLASVLSTVLERNVSTETVVHFKTSLLQLIMPLLPGIIGVFPRWNIDQAQHLIQLSYFIAVSMWPSAHPPPAVRKALERPELAAACINFEPDLTRALTTCIRGIDAGAGR